MPEMISYGAAAPMTGAPPISGAPPVGGAPPVLGTSSGGGGNPYLGMMGGGGPSPMAAHAAMPSMYMPPPAPVAPQPRQVGNNGFGIRQDVTHDDLVNYLMPKFRGVESSGNYKASRKDGGTASGAYGYIDSTWNNYKGFPTAKDAPPEIQDERMKQDLSNSLARFGGDPFKVVASHYYPALASNPAAWDQPIKNHPDAMTVKDYVSRVLPPNRVAAYLAHAKGSSQ
jgi:hypothetical protein